MKSLIWFFLMTFFICGTQADCHYEVLSETPKILIIHDFLTPEECDYLIMIARPALARSTVVNESQGRGANDVDPRRTSQGTFLMRQQRDALVHSIENRLSALSGFPKENGEAIQVLFYEKGAEYQPHYDFFDPKSPGGAVHLLRGGQRAATVIMYLNTPLQGGETIFPEAKVAIVPIKGSAILFYNSLPSGEVDVTTLHGGAPVIEGEKWIATKWFRTSRFQ
jgi:prolyl 4-hydroxylase